MSAETDPFRWCVYCHADCRLPDPPHADDCPAVTGVHVVSGDMLGPICAYCGERAGEPPVCTDCGAVLNVGDRYMLREVAPGDPFGFGIEAASVSEVICVGCKALDTTREV